MNWTINGLPMHPLLVHAAVVLMPVAALMALVGAVWPAARRRMGIVTPILATVGAFAVAFTMQAGEALAETIKETALSKAHVEGGEAAVPWIVLLVGAAWIQWGWFAFGKKRYAEGPKAMVNATAAKVLPIVVAALVAIGAIGSIVAVIAIGDAGAKAVWSHTTAP